MPVLARFWIGAAGALASGLMVFRLAVFDPALPQFRCLTTGVLAAGVIALVRMSHWRQALGLVIVFAVVRLGLANRIGWALAAPIALSELFIGWGLFIIAVVYHLLASRGLRFGKFLIVGPLLGGIFLAATPLMEFHSMTQSGVWRALLLNTLLGVVIGHGVGFGVELAEAVLDQLARSRA